MKSVNLNALSAVSFEDYVRLRQQIEADGEKPTEVLGQHDHDNVTFSSAYEVINEHTKCIMDYVDKTTMYYADLISSLCGLLSRKKVLTDAEVQEISKIANTLYEQDLKERNKEQFTTIKKCVII